MNLACALQRIALKDPARPALFHGEALLHDYGDWACVLAGSAGGLRAGGCAACANGQPGANPYTATQRTAHAHRAAQPYRTRRTAVPASQ